MSTEHSLQQKNISWLCYWANWCSPPPTPNLPLRQTAHLLQVPPRHSIISTTNSPITSPQRSFSLKHHGRTVQCLGLNFLLRSNNSYQITFSRHGHISNVKPVDNVGFGGGKFGKFSLKWASDRSVNEIMAYRGVDKAIWILETWCLMEFTRCQSRRWRMRMVWNDALNVSSMHSIAVLL